MGFLFGTNATAQTSAGSEGPLSNGSFEQEGIAAGGKSHPEGWMFFSDTNAFTGAYVDGKSQVHSGERAVSIMGEETTAGDSSAMWLSDSVEVKPGSAYSVEGWIQTSKCIGKGAWLWILPYEEKDGKELATEGVGYERPIKFVSGAEDWMEWSAVISIPQNVHWLRIACRLDGPGTAWFDDIKVSKPE
jgi:hypothetical protein